MSPRDSREIRENVLLALGCLVVITWVVVVLIHAAYPAHEVPTEVHGIAFLVATALFGSAARQSRRGGNGNSG